ncbi:hypothetical protein [Lacticaseibacillus jixiensis]|uniref:hypothetical protein n=1 Tax=Lacticaseibacillus jixiensis TaxID=3231926 RepID=UPI0036F3E5CE
MVTIEAIKAAYQKRYFALGLKLPDHVDDIVWQWLAQEMAAGHGMPLQLPEGRSIRFVPFFDQSLHEEALPEEEDYPDDDYGGDYYEDYSDRLQELYWAVRNWERPHQKLPPKLTLQSSGWVRSYDNWNLNKAIKACQETGLMDANGHYDKEQAFQNFYHMVIGSRLPTPKNGKFETGIFPDIKEVVACLKANDTAFCFLPDDYTAPEVSGQLWLPHYTTAYYYTNGKKHGVWPILNMYSRQN